MTEVFWINDAIQIFDFPSAFLLYFRSPSVQLKSGHPIRPWRMIQAATRHRSVTLKLLSPSVCL